jgi:hypothetical protein
MEIAHTAATVSGPVAILETIVQQQEIGLGIIKHAHLKRSGDYVQH